MAKMVEYLLTLPVFKQGDDLNQCIQTAGDLNKGFTKQAESYEEAARLCRRMASVADEHPVKVTADTHMIVVDGPDDLLKALVEEGLLRADEYEVGADDFE